MTNTNKCMTHRKVSTKLAIAKYKQGYYPFSFIYNTKLDVIQCVSITVFFVTQ